LANVGTSDIHTDTTRKYITAIRNGYFRGETLMNCPENFTLLSFTSDRRSHLQYLPHCVTIITWGRSHDRDYSNLATLTTGEVHYSFRQVYKHGS